MAGHPAASPASLLLKTRSAFIGTRILSTPCWALLMMLSIFLYKDFHILPFQIVLLTALKPLSALLAPYWSVSLHKRPDRLLPNLVWANVLRFVPFLLFPWVNSPWYMILAFCLYMVLSRGAIPAWMEVLRRNVPGMAREEVFAYGTAMEYVSTAVMPLLFGVLLDQYHEAWRWLFAFSAVIGLLSTGFLLRIPLLKEPFIEPSLSLKQQAWLPWQQAWNLIKARPDFLRYQLGFMFGAAGLMVIQPALPALFIDNLHLSYTELLMAFALCKGVGFAMSSPLWVRYFRKANIFSFSGTVTLLAALFPLLLLTSLYQSPFVYGAYILYGFMQAGSEMSWHLSGPSFAKEGDSSIFSSTNVLVVGLRGSVIPFLGGALLALVNAPFVMVCGCALSLMGACILYNYSQKQCSSPI